jgi:hypothetical protein
MSEQEHEQQAQDEKVNYPGRLDQYHALRDLREGTQVNDVNFAGLAVAEQLAGLAYILDGIRYYQRNPK